ncbi:MAG: hypothetical protein Q9170_007197 [Blastenia crenularia]
MTMVGLGRNVRVAYSSGPTITFLLTGVIEVSLVLLAFIGTLIYASVIYHRHRRGLPYHPSSERKAASDIERYKGPFTDTTLGTVDHLSPVTGNNRNNRDSASAPEVDVMDEKREVGELDGEREIREMDDTQQLSGQEKDDRLRRDPKELEGDKWVYELSASRSVREQGSRDVVGEREMAELQDGRPKVPDE